MEEYEHECVSHAANAALSHPGFPAHKAAMVEGGGGIKYS